LTEEVFTLTASIRSPFVIGVGELGPGLAVPAPSIEAASFKTNVVPPNSNSTKPTPAANVHACVKPLTPASSSLMQLV